MKLHCPHCGVKGSADDSYLGKNVKCPKCREIFLASGSLAPEQSEDTVAEPALSAAPGDHDLLGDSDDLSEEEDILDELGMLAEEEMPADEAADHQYDNGDYLSEETEVDTPVSVESEIKEEVLDWSDIVSEIDAQVGEEQVQNEEDSEGAPAEFSSMSDDPELTDKELGVSDAGVPDTAEVQAESAASAPDGSGEEELLPTTGDQPGIAQEAASRIKEGQAEPAQSGEIQESDFVFADQEGEKEAFQEVVSQPYGVEKEQCWQCGRKDSVGLPFIAKDGRLYCPDCVPAEPWCDTEEQGLAENEDDESPFGGRPNYRFSIGGALREAWQKTKGAKGAIWAGSAVMYLSLLILVAGGAFILPMAGTGSTADINMTGMIGNVLFQVLTDVVSVVFTAGLLFMAITKVVGKAISWKMVFHGFTVAGKIIVATILQSILVFVGILLLVLPGIYLAVGYTMTLPLIMDRGMSPWQAMEASRKAIHKVWWKVAGLFLLMGLICLVSIIPLGIGLIWTWPMFFILAGVVYRYLFGVEKKIG